MSEKIFYLASYVTGLTIRTERMPVMGETLMGRDFNFGPGGKGFNQAVAASRLGANVSFMSLVGNDYFGRYAAEVIQREAIEDFRLIKHPTAPTSVGFVTLSEKGENSILLDPGANALMRVEDVEQVNNYIAQAQWTVSQLEVPVECTLRAFEIARSHGRRTLLNPAPAQRLPAELLALSDVLTPNESECRILLGLAPDDPTPTDELAQQLRRLGVQSLVITMGSQGALCVQEGELVHVPSYSVDVVDTTGAGDCFNGALAVALLQGRSLVEATRYAVLAGAYSTQFMGVIDGLPYQTELQDFQTKLEGK